MAVALIIYQLGKYVIRLLCPFWVGDRLLGAKGMGDLLLMHGLLLADVEEGTDGQEDDDGCAGRCHSNQDRSGISD